MYFFLRPGCFLNESDGRISAVVGKKVGNDLRKARTGKKDAERGPVRTEALQRFLFGHGRCPSVTSSKNHRLCDFRLCQFGCEKSRRRNKGRDARYDFVFDSQPVEPSHLFGCSTVKRRIPRVKTGYIDPFILGIDIISLLLFKVEIRGINYLRAASAMKQH